MSNCHFRAFLLPSDLQLELEYWAETGEFDEDELHEVYTHLTHCIVMDSSTAVCWMGPFVILGVSNSVCHFYSIFNGNNVDREQMPHYVVSNLGLQCLPLILLQFSS